MISQLTVFLENEKGPSGRSYPMRSRMPASTCTRAVSGRYRGFRCGPYAVRYAE